MKSLTKALSGKWILLTGISIFIFSACKKQIDQPSGQDQIAAAAKDHGHLKQTNTYSSDVVYKWIDMQLRLMRTSSPFIGGLPVSRVFGYTGIALYESVVPGMPAYQSLSGQLNQFPDMPNTEPGFAYHWPSNANAALAAMTRNFFPTTSAANKISIDSLENALNDELKARRMPPYYNALLLLENLLHNWFLTGQIRTMPIMQMIHIHHLLVRVYGRLHHPLLQ
jgi:hypothetical protein